MSELKPPFIFDWDGDLRAYDSLRDLACDLEPQDVTGLRNKIAYDSTGRIIHVTLDLPKTSDYQTWAFEYPAKFYARLPIESALEALKHLLQEWYFDLKSCYPEKTYPDMADAGLPELIAFAHKETQALKAEQTKRLKSIEKVFLVLFLLVVSVWGIIWLTRHMK